MINLEKREILIVNKKIISDFSWERNGNENCLIELLEVVANDIDRNFHVRTEKDRIVLNYYRDFILDVSELPNISSDYSFEDMDFIVKSWRSIISERLKVHTGIYPKKENEFTMPEQGLLHRSIIDRVVNNHSLFTISFNDTRYSFQEWYGIGWKDRDIFHFLNLVMSQYFITIYESKHKDGKLVQYIILSDNDRIEKRILEREIDFIMTTPKWIEKLIQENPDKPLPEHFGKETLKNIQMLELICL